MGVCKKCGIVKSTKLSNGEQICDDCLDSGNIDNNITNEQKNLNNEVGEGFFSSIGIGLAFFLLFIGIAYFITGKSRENKIENDINMVEKSIKNIPKTDIFENYQAYKTLSDFYKDNNNYRKEYEKYEKLNKLSADCSMKATSINREYTLNKNSYRENSFGNNKTTMINNETIVRRIEFSVKNDFGMEINYISEYECTLNGLIKQISMYRK